MIAHITDFCKYIPKKRKKARNVGLMPASLVFYPMQRIKNAFIKILYSVLNKNIDIYKNLCYYIKKRRR